MMTGEGQYAVRNVLMYVPSGMQAPTRSFETASYTYVAEAPGARRRVVEFWNFVATEFLGSTHSKRIQTQSKTTKNTIKTF